MHLHQTLAGAKQDPRNMGTRKLSILITTIPDRLGKHFPEMVAELQDQTTGRDDVEILALVDNRVHTVGTKRNLLMGMAEGEYITFVDDDDQISSDYVDSILKAIGSNPGVDVIQYDLMLHHGGLDRDILCTYDTRLVTAGYITEDVHIAKGSHINVWRRELSEGCLFPDQNFGEDSAWAEKMAEKVERFYKIEKVLYHYHFDPIGSATRSEFRSIENKLRKAVLDVSGDSSHSH